jgi:hypothetical protein
LTPCETYSLSRETRLSLLGRRVGGSSLALARDLIVCGLRAVSHDEVSFLLEHLILLSVSILLFGVHLNERGLLRFGHVVPLNPALFDCLLMRFACFFDSFGSLDAEEEVSRNGLARFHGLVFRLWWRLRNLRQRVLLVRLLRGQTYKYFY